MRGRLPCSAIGVAHQLRGDPTRPPNGGEVPGDMVPARGPVRSSRVDGIGSRRVPADAAAPCDATTTSAWSSRDSSTDASAANVWARPCRNPLVTLAGVGLALSVVTVVPGGPDGWGWV